MTEGEVLVTPLNVVFVDVDTGNIEVFLCAEIAGDPAAATAPIQQITEVCVGFSACFLKRFVALDECGRAYQVEGDFAISTMNADAVGGGGERELIELVAIVVVLAVLEGLSFTCIYVTEGEDFIDEKVFLGDMCFANETGFQAVFDIPENIFNVGSVVGVFDLVEFASVEGKRAVGGVGILGDRPATDFQRIIADIDIINAPKRAVENGLHYIFSQTIHRCLIPEG